MAFEVQRATNWAHIHVSRYSQRARGSSHRRRPTRAAYRHIGHRMGTKPAPASAEVPVFMLCRPCFLGCLWVLDLLGAMLYVGFFELLPEAMTCYQGGSP